ncbi:MAG: bifunctional hydroxymethylpyrimidine kinase/phosphomethylpyrimidine kinase [Hyphomonadaceae bacterium]
MGQASNDASEQPAFRGRVLIVAGSDSGGGAGIQADIKSVTALGGFAATAVTAITIQNTLWVSGVIGLDPKVVRAQMQAVLGDIGADCLKTGMLGDRKLIEAVVEAADDLARDVPRVVDPVMVATSGDRLLPADAVDAMRQLMVPGAVLVTPNAPEAEVLTGKAVETLDGQRRAAERLLEMGAVAALVKGGHIGSPDSDEPIIDVLAMQSGERFLDGPRIRTSSTHGTGCSLASGVAAGLARGLDLVDAVDLARAYLVEAIRRAPGLGRGHGPIDHGWPSRDPEGFAELYSRYRVQ